MGISKEFTYHMTIGKFRLFMQTAQEIKFQYKYSRHDQGERILKTQAKES